MYPEKRPKNRIRLSASSANRAIADQFPVLIREETIRIILRFCMALILHFLKCCFI